MANKISSVNNSVNNINLLPADIRKQQLEEGKFRLVQTISVLSMLVLIFLASATFALGILQSQNVKNANLTLKNAEAKVTQLQSKEESAVVLKNRLDTLGKYLYQPSPQRAVFSVVNTLIPSAIAVSSISVDSSGSILISAVSTDIDSVNSFLENLVSPGKNDDKIKSVDIENLSRGRDGFYTFNLKVNTK